MLLKQVFLIAIPALLALAGLLTAIRWLTDFRGGLRLPARVTGYVESRSSEGKLFRAQLEYEAAGQVWQILDEMSFGWRVYRVGEQVQVRISEDDPSKGRICRVWPLVMGTGLFVVSMALVWLIWSKGTE